MFLVCYSFKIIFAVFGFAILHIFSVCLRILVACYVFTVISCKSFLDICLHSISRYFLQPLYIILIILYSYFQVVGFIRHNLIYKIDWI